LTPKPVVLVGGEELRGAPSQGFPLDRIAGHRGGPQVQDGRLAIAQLLGQGAL
jgi:hypothetical protein